MVDLTRNSRGSTREVFAKLSSCPSRRWAFYTKRSKVMDRITRPIMIFTYYSRCIFQPVEHR